MQMVRRSGFGDTMSYDDFKDEFVLIVDVNQPKNTQDGNKKLTSFFQHLPSDKACNEEVNGDAVLLEPTPGVEEPEIAKCDAVLTVYSQGTSLSFGACIKK